MKEYAVVQRVDFTQYERVIVVSDLHGDCAGFDEMLDNVGFGSRDALVIIGDILERGEESLRLLKRVATLSACGRVYGVLGNNDTILLEWLDGSVGAEQILGYIRSRENSVVLDMAKELKATVDTVEAIAALRAMVIDRYADELAYLASLPHILDSELATFVHAGVKPGDLEAQDPAYCLTAKAFSMQGYRFDKPVIVGHWPASNYSKTTIDVNVHIHQEGNIYSIDGGNSMKSWGQINVLLLHPDGRISCCAFDRCKKIRLLDAQRREDAPLTLTFPNTRLENVRVIGEKRVGFVPYLGREMVFDKERIYSYKGELYCSDFTTHQPEVQAGEVVSYCKTYEDGILIKRDGIVGKYLGRYEFV